MRRQSWVGFEHTRRLMRERFKKSSTTEVAGDLLALAPHSMRTKDAPIACPLSHAQCHALQRQHGRPLREMTVAQCDAYMACIGQTYSRPGLLAPEKKAEAARFLFKEHERQSLDLLMHLATKRAVKKVALPALSHTSIATLEKLATFYLGSRVEGAQIERFSKPAQRQEALLELALAMVTRWEPAEWDDSMKGVPFSSDTFFPRAWRKTRMAILPCFMREGKPRAAGSEFLLPLIAREGARFVFNDGRGSTGAFVVRRVLKQTRTQAHVLVQVCSFDFKLKSSGQREELVLPRMGATLVRKSRARSLSGHLEHAHKPPATVARPRLPKKCVDHIFRYLHRLALGGPVGLMAPTTRAFLHHVRDVPEAELEYPHWVLTPAAMREITTRAKQGDDPYAVAMQIYERCKTAEFRSGREA